MGLVEVIPSERYIRLTVPGTLPKSRDDVELSFIDEQGGNGGGIVNVRCSAQNPLPMAPFCVKKDCINGAMDQRERVQRLSRIVGLPPADQFQMRDSAKWTPIFFNSDRVPDFGDDGYDETY